MNIIFIFRRGLLAVLLTGIFTTVLDLFVSG